MSQSAALMPVPFYPPARTGTGSFLNFRAAARRPPLLVERRRRAAVAVPDQGLAYDREGRLLADVRTGTLLSIYA